MSGGDERSSPAPRPGRRELRTRDYLEHMLDAASQARSFVEGMDYDAFLADRRTRDAVIRNLEVVGEAARNILRTDPAFATAHPGLPLTAAYQMRNALTHGYAVVDPEVVWRTVRERLPLLEASLRALLASYPE